MYSLKLRYLGSVFLDAASVTPTPERTHGLSEALNDDQLSLVQAAETVGDEQVSRIAFSNSNMSLRLVISSQRIDFSAHPTVDDGSNMGTFGEFCDLAATKLRAVLSYLDRRAHRVAAVQEGLVGNLDTKDLEDIGARALNLPAVLSAHSPFEWDWRTAVRVERTFADLTEITNTIVSMKRATGTITKHREDISDFDGLRVDLDINTSPDNNSDRFTGDHAAQFFASAIEWHESLAHGVADWLGLDQTK